MNQIWLIIQGVLAVILVALILLQAQGSGLGSTWGGGGETYHTKRGVEKVVFYLTIVGVITFTLVSVLALI
ncbi:MAG: preprotein translocase subunit SecG [Patescibacteria group bacterium]|nr:preprotein translocase subunit SecG [Patescibacteria group bacterium]